MGPPPSRPTLRSESDTTLAMAQLTTLCACRLAGHCQAIRPASKLFKTSLIGYGAHSTIESCGIPYKHV